MYLVSLETLVLEELLHGRPMMTKDILESIRIRIPEVDLDYANLYMVVRKMGKQGLIQRTKTGSSVLCELTPLGTRKAEENRQTVWKIFPPPPQEPDSTL